MWLRYQPCKRGCGCASYPMDQSELETLFMSAYDSYVGELYRFCVLKVSNKEKAEDLVQEVFSRYWQTLREGTPVLHPRAFLYTLARNRIIDWYRKKKEASLDQLQEGGLDVVGEGAASVEEAARMREVLAVVDELDDRSRDAVLLRYVEGWTPQEIADLTNETANAISVRLNRAIKQIQKRIHA